MLTTYEAVEGLMDCLQTFGGLGAEWRVGRGGVGAAGCREGRVGRAVPGSGCRGGVLGGQQEEQVEE